MIEGIVETLNQNAGAVTAVATIVYAVITLGLLRESRASRLEASVIALAEPWDRGHVYVSVTLENLGPTVAKNVEFTLDLRPGGGGEVEDHRRLFQGYLAPGRHRRFLPRATSGMRPLQELADAGYVLELAWSWQDGRRDWAWRSVTSKGAWSAPLAELATDYFGGGALVERTAEHELSRLVDEVKGARERLDRIHAVLDEPRRRRQERELEGLFDRTGSPPFGQEDRATDG